MNHLGYVNSKIKRLQDELEQVEQLLSRWKQQALYARDPNEEGQCAIAIERLNNKVEEIMAQLERLGQPAGGRTIPGASSQLILFVCSSPSEKNPLNFGIEFKAIREARDAAVTRENFQVEIETAVTADRLVRLLFRYKPAIIHISMHASKSRGLYFEDAQGMEHPVTADELHDKFELFSESHVPDLVILSACNSGEHARAITPFARHVIGTQDFFPDPIAVFYTRNLYQMLFDGHGVALAHRAAQLELRHANIPREEQERLSMPIHEIPVLFSNP